MVGRLSPVYTTPKRAIDIVAALVGLVVLSPLFAAVAVAIRRSSPGPIIHRARRTGRDASTFTLYKFRTMRVGAATSGPGVTVSGDPRITRVGAALRRTKLDELPQLLNVLLGDMSLVGPRPEDPRYVEWYSDAQRSLLRLRPGITSAASLRYHDEERVLAEAAEEHSDLDAAYRSVLREKLAVDLAHWARPSLVRDLGLIVETIVAIVRR